MFMSNDLVQHIELEDVQDKISQDVTQENTQSQNDTNSNQF
jgi:hypothetical protein